MATPTTQATQGTKKPNILFIMADDIGWFNVSAYNLGMMGYRTPNIDRIAKEGALFTDFYGQQSCTAGRAAFITGQSPIRTGLTKVGMPGATARTQRRGSDASRQFMKNLGYATGQFGKNHLGDRNEYSADRARLRRVLRQSLSPERRRGAGESGLSRRIRNSARSSVRAGCCDARPRTRTTPRSTRSSARSASKRSRTRARSTRSGWRRSTKSSSPPLSISWNGRRKEGKPWLLLLQYHAHAHLHPSETVVRRQDRLGAFIPTGWWNSTATSASCSRSSRI